MRANLYVHRNNQNHQHRFIELSDGGKGAVEGIANIDNEKHEKLIYLVVNRQFVVEANISESLFKALSSKESSKEACFALSEEFLSNLFHNEENLQDYLPICASIELIARENIPILKQVIIQSVSKSNIDDWIEENEQEVPLLINRQVSSVITRFNTFVIRDDGMKLEFQVVDSSPTRQGLVDTNTTKVILISGGVKIPNRIFSLSSIESDILEDEATLDGLLSSDFIVMKPKKSIVVHEIEHVTTEKILKYLEENDLKNKIDPKCDPNSLILLNSNHFATLQCFDNSWVTLNATHNVVICAIHGKNTPNGAIMTNVLYFNIGKPRSIEITTSEQPKIASRVVLTPIQSPNHFGNTLVDGTEEEQALEQRLFEKQLEVYFSSHNRVLKKNDIIMVNNPTIAFIKPEDSFQVQVLSQLESAKRIDPVHGDYTCYRVENSEIASISSEDSFIVSSSETTLITNGNPVKGYIPSHINNDDDNCESVICKQISKLVEPIISIHQPSKDVRSSQKKLIQQHFLLHGEEGSGKTFSVRSICSKYGFHLIEINAFEIINESDSLTAQNLAQCFTLARQCTPCILYIKNFEAFDQLSAGGGNGGANVKQHSKIRIVKCLKQCLKPKSNQYPLIFIPSVSSLSLLSPVFKNLFLTKIECKRNLGELEREAYLKKHTTDIADSCNIDLSIAQVVKQTSGCSVHDLNKIVQISKSLAVVESVKLMQDYNSERSISSAIYTSTLSHKHFVNGGMKWHKKYAAGVSGSNASSTTNVSIPTVKWQDIGGLENAKQEILDIIQSPLQTPNLKTRSGILLYGPPGCGKTLLAKAVATECQLNFMSVKGPELINMYVGESERNVRLVFERARQCKPCVIFFDELDALAPNRGVSGDSGGVMDRVVSQMLAELDDISNVNEDSQGSNSNKGVYVIGATNRPDLIDPALLRPGRFERLVYLGVCTTIEDQIKVMQALTRKFNLSDDVDLEKILLDHSKFNLTGADFYAICTDAFMSAVGRVTNNGDALGAQSHQIVVCGFDFEKAFQTITPSVSVSDMERYESLQSNFKN